MFTAALGPPLPLTLPLWAMVTGLGYAALLIVILVICGPHASRRTPALRQLMDGEGSELPAERFCLFLSARFLSARY